MNTGLMWFDNRPNKSLAEKVAEAATHFEKKYGRMPNTCLVNPKMMTNGKTSSDDGNDPAGQITVRPYEYILPHHLWIGVEEGGFVADTPIQAPVMETV